MTSRLFATSLLIICTPLSIGLLGLWCLYAASVFFYGDFWRVLGEDLRALMSGQNVGPAFYTLRQFIAVFGGAIGWLSLIALTFVSQRAWSQIPKAIKVGCLVGAVSAVALPTAPGLALPPILLCASLSWFALKRDAYRKEQAQ